SNNEQSMLPKTGENKSITTVLLGFVGMILGVMISYKQKDS
ncbi:MAG: LPXTG cell wall anchor domain-containing protein, partial [Streptococcus mitis]|nr:LPXTG cell wall anchor domain-containing protein [Streptococcus mitis]